MRSIIHVDMDEFFAAVEKLDNPELRGKPLLIGGEAKARGVVATASYEARVFGCHSAMPMAQAVRLCPQAIVLPVRGSRYGEVSGQVFAILRQFTPMVEPLSIDEAFLDVTGCDRLYGSAVEIAAQIKARIKGELGLTASVGVSYNKFLAKLASDFKKPDGLFVIDPEHTQEILDPLSVTKIFGVGPATAKQLERLNIHTIAQLRKAPMDLLKETLGAAGAVTLSDLARGQDDRPVEPYGKAKSIGAEETFASDIGDRQKLRSVLAGQVDEVAKRLREHGLLARTVTLKIRYGDFTTITRSQTLADPTSVTQELLDAAAGIFDQWASEHFRPLRLLGTSASGLSTEAGRQLSLFEKPSSAKQQRLDEALDRIAGKFGDDAVRRAKKE